MSNFNSVKEFMRIFGQEIKAKPGFPSEKITQLRYNLIKENSKNYSEKVTILHKMLVSTMKLYTKISEVIIDLYPEYDNEGQLHFYLDVAPGQDSVDLLDIVSDAENLGASVEEISDGQQYVIYTGEYR